MEKIFKNESWTPRQLSPNIKEAIAKSPPINKSRLKADLVKACKQLNISSSQQTKDVTVHQEGSSKELKTVESPEVLVLPGDSDEHIYAANNKKNENSKGKVEKVEETMKVTVQPTSSSMQVADAESLSKVKSSPDKSSFPTKKSMSSPILNKLGEMKLASSTTESTSGRNEESNCSLKNLKISEGIKNLRKMFKSASFATVSVKSTNNGVKREKGAEPGAGVKMKSEAKCEESVQGEV